MALPKESLDFFFFWASVVFKEILSIEDKWDFTYSWILPVTCYFPEYLLRAKAEMQMCSHQGPYP